MKKVMMILFGILILTVNIYCFTPEPTVVASGSVVTTTIYGYPLMNGYTCGGDNSQVCCVLQKHYPSQDASDYGNWPTNSKINFFTPSIGVNNLDNTTPGTGYIDALLNEPLSIPGSAPYPGPIFRIDGGTQTFSNYGNWFNSISSINN